MDQHELVNHLADLLETLYTAPRCATFRGGLRRWFDPSTMIRGRQEAGHDGVGYVIAGDLDEIEEITSIWWDRRGRSRMDVGERTTVVDGDTQMTYTPGFGLMEAPIDRFEMLVFPNWMWSPRPLISEVEVHGIDVAAGQHGCEVFRVSCETSPSRGFARLTGMALGGERFEFDVDRNTGIVLNSTGWLMDGSLVSRTHWAEFTPGADVPTEVFEQAFPADVRVTTFAERIIDHARDCGVDVSGVDPELPPDDVNEMIRKRLQRYRHVPSGPPPADEEAAHNEIVRIFADVAEADGDDLVHVQAGEGLAPARRRGLDRFEGAALKVSDVQFLSASEAIVYLTVRTDQRILLTNYEARAVTDNHEWKIARRSLTSLLGLAGISCL